MSTGKRLASVVIAAVLLFQTLAAFRITPGPIGDAPYLWPFLDYPMYSIPHFPGDTIRRHELYGVRPDSSEFRLEAADLGLNFWLFQRELRVSLWSSDTSSIRDYAHLFESRQDEPLGGFRIYVDPLVLTESGVEPASRFLDDELLLPERLEP